MSSEGHHKNQTLVGLSRCNRAHLHIVFVLLYSVCRSVSICSRVDVIQAFTYVLRVVILDVTKRRGERQRERKREAIPTVSRINYTIKRKEEKEKTGTSGCGSFVVLYFQPATSTDRLHT